MVILANNRFVSSIGGAAYLNGHAYKESVWCEVLFQRKKVLIGVIYRTPAST